MTRITVNRTLPANTVATATKTLRPCDTAVLVTTDIPRKGMAAAGVADMEVTEVADMEVTEVVDMEVTEVVDMEAIEVADLDVVDGAAADMVAEGVVAMVAGMVATEEAMEDRRVAMVEAMVPHLVEVMGAAMVVRQMHTEVLRLAAMLDMEPHKPLAMEHHRVPMEANRLLMEEQVNIFYFVSLQVYQ